MRRSMGALLIALAATACRDTAGPELILDAFVRVVHASPDAPRLSVRIGNNETGVLDYAEVTEYNQLGAGDRSIVIRRAADNEVLIDTVAPFEADGQYTLYAIGAAADIRPLLVRDDAVRPDTGFALLRVVHAAPTIGDVDVHITSPTDDLAQAFITDIRFATASGYEELERGTYRVRVAAQGTPNLLVDIPLVVLSSGQIVTLVIMDAIGGGPPHGLLVPTPPVLR